ncbi:hypothetical protein [Halomicrobium katesii]|uniref:hypothetical protein n=1 Tax=Halomicrobium katesii TaxID=437163 RepID=UPI0012BABD27|nr:hypothetical protein [Halomicrobium katesii]
MAETTENRVKIGAKVNESVYAEFKQHIHDKTGQKRGVLGEAVEAALRQYMDENDSDIDGDVSNADLMREIRALRSTDETHPPRPPSDGSNSDGVSTGSVSSDASSSPTDDTPAPPPGDDKETLAKEKSGESEKPPVNAAIGDRVAWVSSEVNIQGRVPFDTLVKEVGRQYPQHSDGKCRELAWRWAAMRAPTPEDYPDDDEYSGEYSLDKLDPDSELQKRAKDENNPRLHTWPRRHSNGAWFRITEARSDASMNHQEPTERGDVVVYLGVGGARKCAEDMELLDSGVDEEESFRETWGSGDLRSRLSRDSDESDESAESDGVSSDDFDGVDIDGAESDDESGESSEAAEEEADELSLDDLDGADRGQE